MKSFFIADAPRFENESITSFFTVASFSVRERRGGGGQYLALTLADRTGSFEARMWEDFASAVASCAEGCYVKVQGQVARYQNRFQITIARMRQAAESEIDPADFIATTQFDIDAMWNELRGFATGFANDDLRRLVFSFLDDEQIAAAFRRAPAAKRLHHAWIGGLLEHVLSLVRLCAVVAPSYPEVDAELLMTGAILHDIGKVRELTWDGGFGYSMEGQLIGHISIAHGMLREKLMTLPEFPDRLRMLVEHMILSHHGRHEFGSPKLPMSPEALLLNVLDDLEAKMQTLRSEFAREAAAGRSGAELTEWVRSLERPLLNSRAFLAAGTPAAASETADAIESASAEGAEAGSQSAPTSDGTGEDVS